MAHSLNQIYLHIVFSTKERKPFLEDKTLRKRTHAYLAGICNNLQCPAILIGGVEDHVHILCRLGRSISVAELIQELKRDSSKWVKQQPGGAAEFYWQDGYGAFSISPGHVEALKDYIANQEEHHKKVSYQDEFRRLCKKYGVELDERHAWD